MAHDFTSKSFRDVVREQRGLLVHPLRWTPRHLELLGCRFEDAPTAPVFPETPNDQRRPPERPDDAETLAMSLSAAIKCYSLENILLGEEPKSTRPRYDLRSTKTKIPVGMTDKGLQFHSSEEGAPFYFRGRRVHQPDYTVLHRHRDSLGNMSYGLVGFLHYASVDVPRCRQFEPRPGAAIFSAGRSYRQKQLAQVIPKEWTEDPYFLCVLLALAQMEKRKLPGLSRPIIYIPRLMVTRATDHEYIHLYETGITPELLEGLRDPDNATQPLQCTIWRKRISYKPYDSFASRLIAELNTSHALSQCHSVGRFNYPQIALYYMAVGNPQKSITDENRDDNDVNRAIEHKKARQGEPEDSGSRKRRRVQADD